MTSVDGPGRLACIYDTDLLKNRAENATFNGILIGSVGMTEILVTAFEAVPGPGTYLSFGTIVNGNAITSRCRTPNGSASSFRRKALLVPTTNTIMITRLTPFQITLPLPRVVNTAPGRSSDVPIDHNSREPTQTSD